MEFAEKILLLIFNLSIGLSLFRLLVLTVRSKWGVTYFKFKYLDLILFVGSALALFVIYQSYSFKHLFDWLLVLLLILYSIEKGVWKFIDAKRNSVLFVLLLFVTLFFQIELGSAIGNHFSNINPLLFVYSMFLCGMVIWLLFSGKNLPPNSGKYLFYAVFFKAYLYFSKLVITWYVGFPAEISWINLQSAPNNYYLLISVGVGIIIPFILFFPNLFKSRNVLKIGLCLLLLSSVPEMLIIYN